MMWFIMSHNVNNIDNDHAVSLPICSWKQMMRCFVGYYTTKRTFYIRTYLRGHKSFTPSVL